MILAAFPPSDLLRRQPSVSSFVFFRRPLAKLLGRLFMQLVLGHEDASGRSIDANGATRAKIGGPPRPSTVAAWGPLSAFWPPLFSILFPNALFLPKNDPRKFSAHLDVVWVTETSKYRK